MHLTFDVELYMPLREDPRFRERQVATWERVLDVLDRHEVNVTHFVTGEFALAHPETFRRMVERGDEIASHTMTHRPYETIGDAAFEEEIATSRGFLEKASGRPVRGFRAPLGQAPGGLAGMLHRHGYAYDSSIAATHIPGHFKGLGTPKRPYRPSLDDVRREAPASPILEIPVAVAPLVPIPMGGIFLSGLSGLVRAVRRARRDPHVMFLHPYDFMDLRRVRGAYPWDRVKLTRANWKLLEFVARERRGQDTRLDRIAGGATAGA